AWIKVMLEKFFCSLCGNLLDVHSTRSRSHENGLSLGTVNEDAKIKLHFDGQSFLNQQTTYDAAFRASLVGYERHAQHFGGVVARLLNRLGNLYTPAFAASSGVNLSLDHNPRGSRIKKILGDSFRFFAGLSHLAARNS